MNKRIIFFIVGIILIASLFCYIFLFYNKGEKTLISVDSILENNSLSLVGEELTLIGILNVPTENMTCAGNCVRVPTLEGINLRKFMPLFDNIKPEDSGKLIKVSGKVIETPEGTIPNFDYFGENPQISLRVSNYEIISNISYHEFLISESTKYIIEKFGCAFSHDKNIGWTIENNIPYLTVKWDRYNDSYITLYYDVNGKLVKVENKIKETNLCG